MTLENKHKDNSNDRVFLHAQSMFEVSRESENDLLKSFEMAVITLNVLNNGKAPSDDPRYQVVLEHILDLSSKIEKLNNTDRVGHLEILSKLNNSNFIVGHTKDYIQYQYAIELANNGVIDDSIELLNQTINRLQENQNNQPNNENLEFLIIARLSLVQIYLLSNNTLAAILETNKTIDLLKDCELSESKHIARQFQAIASDLENKRCYDYSLTCLRKAYDILNYTSLIDIIEYRSKISKVLAKQGYIDKLINYEKESLQIINEHATESQAKRKDHTILSYNINYRLAEKGIWQHVSILEEILRNNEFDWIHKVPMLLQLVNAYTLRGSYEKAGSTIFEISKILNNELPSDLKILYKTHSTHSSFMSEFQNYFANLESEEDKKTARIGLNFLIRLTAEELVLNIKLENHPEASVSLDTLLNLNGLKFEDLQDSNLFCSYLKYSKQTKNLEPEEKLDLLINHQENKKYYSEFELIAINITKLNIASTAKDLQSVEEAVKYLQKTLERDFNRYIIDLDYGDVFVDVTRGLITLGEYKEATNFIFKFIRARRQNRQILEPSFIKMLEIMEDVLSIQDRADLALKVKSTYDKFKIKLKEYDI